MNTILRLTRSSIKMFIRNKQAVFFTMVMPIVIILLLGFLSFDTVPKVEVGVAVTDPPTKTTRQFLDQLKEIPAFDIKIDSEFKERKALEDGDRSVVFIIPGNFFPDGQMTEQKTLKILKNSNDVQQAAIAESIISQILDKTTIAATGAPTIFKIESEEVNSLDLKYIDFLVPGIVALSLMQMSVFSVAFVFADYKEKGVLKRLLATPMKPYEFVTANVVTRLIVAVVQVAVLIAVGVVFFQAHVIGSYWLVLLIIILGAIMFLGLGFTISGFANTVEAVPAIANIVVFPMMFLGGTFFPIDTMPDWLQNIAKYLPLTFLSGSLREVMLHGAQLAEIQHELFWMVGWAVVLIIAANLTFGFEEKRL